MFLKKKESLKPSILELFRIKTWNWILFCQFNHRMSGFSISFILLVLLGLRVGALDSQLQEDFLDILVQYFPKMNVHYFHSLNVSQVEILKSKDVIRTSEPSFYDKLEIQIRRNIFIFSCKNQEEFTSLFNKVLINSWSVSQVFLGQLIIIVLNLTESVNVPIQRQYFYCFP